MVEKDNEMSVKDAIMMAVDGKPGDFQGAIQDELNARIMDQINGLRKDYADSIFAADYETVNDDSDESEEEEEIEDEEL